MGLRIRRDDYQTSIEGARSVSYRADSQKARLLAVYGQYPGWGLSDEEAAEEADLLDSCYWKRCGELRSDGMIEDTGIVRMGRAGVHRIVCRITPAGVEALR